MHEKVPKKFGFYAILTSPLRGYVYLTEVLVSYKIAFVQLRMKEAPRETVVETAEAMKKITAGTATRLIINDHPGIARAIGADGVHIGQSDMPYGQARILLGPEAIIGVSTHSPAQVDAANAASPDYIGVGPVFPTPTKKNPDPVIGLPGMKEMLSLTTLPAVAIGGISLKALPEVLTAGAVNFCMVRPLNESADPEKVVREIVKIYQQFIS